MGNKPNDPSVAPREFAVPPHDEEFAPEALEPFEIPADGLSRRRFLALAGASAALASSTAACSKIDRGSVVPYTRKPVEVLPGVANYYASTFQEGETAYGVLVKTREGRPIHVEGNDEHPTSRGKTSLRAVADVLRLYDPDRLRQPLVDDKPATWAAAMDRLVERLKDARENDRPVLLVTGAVASPTRRALIEEFKRQVPGTMHVALEPAASQAERFGCVAAFGDATLPRLHFDRADVVVSFQRDFLGADPIAPSAIREFTAKRTVRSGKDSMNRLWVVEGGLTLTGAKADHRIGVRPSRSAWVAFAVARALAEKHGIALPGDLPAGALSAETFDIENVAKELRIPAAHLHAMAADLARARGAALVVAGPCVPVETHVAANLINVMLGAEGSTIEAGSATPLPGPNTIEDVRSIFDRVWKLEDTRLAIFWDVNPAYALPDADLFARMVSKVSLRVSIGVHQDETAQSCQVALAENHWLESWGDSQPAPDLLSLQQPAIGPLYDTRQGEEILLQALAALGASVPATYHDYLRAFWEKEVYRPDSPVPFEQFWNAALHDGVVRRPAAPRPARLLRGSRVGKAAANVVSLPPLDLEIEFQPAAAVYDGRYANNGWLQELPDPLTRVTWANPLRISAADAEHFNLSDGDVVRLDAGKRHVEAPVLVQRGQTPGVLTATLGYGRTALSVARDVGVSFYPLMDESATVPHIRRALTLTPTGRRVELPLAQRHQSMDGRDLVRSASLAEYAAGHGNKHGHGASMTLYPEQEFPEHKWGMVIDQSACVGCGGCVVACQSENNIPVVGPEQVLKGREMHWLRVDRYYEGDAASPRVLYQPMLCQQCDNAPCENVCPVNATNHSPDGLNQMVYNRCVGTRYCANNCPYKVRRFNFLEFTATKTEVEQLAFNPEVTVRPRGVMEKCTFCVQRIQDVRQRAKGEERKIRDGEITTACAAACPAQAIVFGDLKDPESAVSKLSHNDRGYKILEELGVRPSVTYLVNLTNPAGNGGKHEG